MAGRPPPQHMVNERPVRILLECILVLISVYKFPEPCSLQPSNEVCEGYFFMGVCLFTGGVCLPHCMLGPEADISPHAVHAGRYGQQASGTHPTGMHTC